MAVKLMKGVLARDEDNRLNGPSHIVFFGGRRLGEVKKNLWGYWGVVSKQGVIVTTVAPEMCWRTVKEFREIYQDINFTLPRIGRKMEIELEV